MIIKGVECFTTGWKHYTQDHTCLPLRLYCIYSRKSWKSLARSGNTDSLSKVLKSVVHEKQQQQTLRFRFFPRVAEAFVPELAKVTFGHVKHVRKTSNADLLSEVLCACAKDTKQKKFLWSFRKAASWVVQNQCAICDKILCTTKSMAESFDCAPAKPSPVKRRCFQRFKKVHHEKWSLATFV